MSTNKKSTTKKTTNKKKITNTTKNKTPVEETQTNTKKNILKKIYIIIITILSLALLITLTIEIKNILTPSENLLPTIQQQPSSTQEIDKLKSLFSNDIDLETSRKENNNNEIVGRIEIPGVFNLLLTQTKDNDYYIEYNIKKKRSNKGTEFIDYRNKFTDKQINIYGHNSRLYDLPFKKLEQFLEKDFFDNNKYLLFQTDSVKRIYQITAIKKVTTDYEHMIINSKKQKDHIEKLLKNSIQSREIEYDEDTNIIILQTCVRQHDGHYYILIGFEVK